MSASTYEYKTVALPQIVQGKRKRGVSEADLVAETFGEVIHLEAIDGWEYMRADILAAGTRGGMFSKEPTVTQYSVLVFRRAMESAWPMHQAQPPERDSRPPSPPRARPAPSSPVIDASPPPPAAGPVRPKPAPVPPREPIAAPAPPPAPKPAATKPAIADPTSPLAQGMVLSTGGRFRADGAPAEEEDPKPAPRPPLGSARD